MSDAGLIRLLDSAVRPHAHDPGYIKGYVPGIRENGGQYTHGVLWFVRAMAEMGRGTRAVELLRMLSPMTRHRDRASRSTIYQTEPYVVAADVYSRAAARRPRRLDLVHRFGRLDVPRRRRVDPGAFDRGRPNDGAASRRFRPPGRAAN